MQASTPPLAGLAIPAPLSAGTLPLDTESFDVIVVGFGIAGGCAALEAARAGARVLVLERGASHGGTSSLSGGHFYLGGGTAVQKATGHQDTAEEMAAYLIAASKQPDDAKIRAYASGSVEHFGWLEALGFQFERSYFAGKAVIQPGTEGLMYTGNEKVWPFREQARPAPRGHKVPVPGDTGGTRMVMDLLRARVDEAGAEVRLETGATRLITSQPDRVAGVAWKSFGATGRAKSGAVILATGGFVMNPAMVEKYTPALGSRLIALGTTHDDGLGIRLAQSAGAALDHMQEPFITAPFYPPPSLVTGLIVNKLGQRFVAEDSYHARTAYHVLQQPDKTAYLIVGSTHMAEQQMQLVPLKDGYDSVAEMERGLGVPPGSLMETMNRYNAYAAKGEDPDFGKHPDWLAPQDTGPWGVFDLSLGVALYAGFTLGGIRTSLDGEALRDDRSAIAGLYAAGACASNIAQDGNGYCSGTQLGEGSFFGRRAGRHAACAAAMASHRDKVSGGLGGGDIEARSHGPNGEQERRCL